MRSWAFVLSLTATLVLGYETVSLVTPLPTISRIVQGWRDNGRGTLVLIISGVVVTGLVWFAYWLWHHFRFGERSNL